MISYENIVKLLFEIPLMTFMYSNLGMYSLIFTYVIK
jgi:hypothetical protein